MKVFMHANKSINYYAEQQSSRQWRDFLNSMGAELTVQLDHRELRQLMTRVGMRFADRFEVTKCVTLDDLQRCINTVWTDLDWGMVEFTESNNLLRIEHACSPLRAVFGGVSSSWNPAFLEGAYQRWFESIGIDPVLRVQQVAGVEDENLLSFTLSRT